MFIKAAVICAIPLQNLRFHEPKICLSEDTNEPGVCKPMGNTEEILDVEI